MSSCVMSSSSRAARAIAKWATVGGLKVPGYTALDATATRLLGGFDAFRQFAPTTSISLFFAMRSTAEKSEGNRVVLHIEFEEEELAPFLESSVRKLSSQVRIPGFRPGKAPRRVVENRVGMKAIRLEAIEEALGTLYPQAVNENDLDVIDSPSVKILTGEDGGEVSVDATVDVRPTVTVSGYENLVVTLPTHISATDEDLSSTLERMREQQAEVNEVDRPAAAGDQVTADIEVSVDGEAKADGSAVDLSFRIGKAEVGSDVDDAVLGLAVGQSASFVREPSEEGGKAEQVKVTIKAVREVVLPALDDAFASEVSEFETLEELKADVRKSFDSMRKNQARQAYNDMVLAALVDLVEPKEIHPTLLREEVNTQIHNFGHRLESQGLNLGTYLDLTGMSQDQLLAQFYRSAEGSVLLDLALRAIADAREVEISISDIDEEIVRIAELSGEDVLDVRKRYSTPEAERALKADLRKSKAMTWYMENVIVHDPDGMPVTWDDLKDDVVEDESSEVTDVEVTDISPSNLESGADE